jgi:putative transposase
VPVLQSDHVAHRDQRNATTDPFSPSKRLFASSSTSPFDQALVVKPKYVRLDNGPELTAEVFTDWAEDHGIELRFIQPGKPNQNAFIERFNKSFREEILDANLFNTLSDAQEAAEIWLEDYNEYRPHESLGDLPPAVFKPKVFKPESSSFEL